LLGVLQRAIADSNIKISNLRLCADDGRHGANQGNPIAVTEMYIQGNTSDGPHILRFLHPGVTLLLAKWDARSMQLLTMLQ